MALTRITKGVIKPNENYDTHNINSTGIVTAIGLDVNGNADVSGSLSVGGVLTYEDVTSIDSVGIITARTGLVSPYADIDDFVSVGSNIHLGNAGVITATSFVGDGSGLIGVASTDNIVTGTAATFNTYPVDINAGMTIAGVTTVANDTEFIIGSNATATRPLKISHTSSSARNQFTSDYIDFNVQDARFRNISNNAQIAQFWTTQVNLFANGTQRFSTSSAGANVYGNLQIESTGPYLQLKDTDHNNDFAIHCNNGSLQFVDTTDSYTNRMSINSSGNVSIVRDLDVDGHTNLDNVSIAGVTTFTGDAHFKGGVEAIKVFGGSDIRFAYGTWNGNTSTPKIQAVNDYLYIAGGSEGIIFRENATNRWHIDGDGHFRPAIDSTYDVGTNSVRVRNVYADTLYGNGANLTGITQTTINNNANNRIITGSGSANTLEGEQRLTYSGSELTNANVTSNEDSAINIYKATGDKADKAILIVGYN